VASKRGKLARPRHQIEMDRVEISALWAKHVPVDEIARQISAKRSYVLSPDQVRYEVQQIHKAWGDQYRRALQDRVNERFAAIGAQLARIDAIEAEAWKAWERSLKDKISKTQYARSGENGQPVPTSAAIRTDPSTGDTRYLSTVQWCVTERSKLLGLYAPEQHELRVQAQDAQYNEQMATIARIRSLADDELEAELDKVEYNVRTQRALLAERSGAIIDVTPEEPQTPQPDIPAIIDAHTERVSPDGADETPRLDLDAFRDDSLDPPMA
jgi:hypothetical protein